VAPLVLEGGPRVVTDDLALGGGGRGVIPLHLQLPKHLALIPVTVWGWRGTRRGHQA
jgi:hypothetical protein